MGDSPERPDAAVDRARGMTLARGEKLDSRAPVAPFVRRALT
jgi:hypothetical protein